MSTKLKVGVTVVIIILSTAVVKSLTPQQAPQYVALITDLKGKVRVQKAQRDEFEKALWGMQLFQGDKLKTFEDAEVSCLFSNNNLVALGPNSTITISKGPLSPKKAPKSIRNMDTELLADHSILTLRKTSEGEIGALAGLRFGSTEQEIELLSPRNSKIKTARPSFQWESKKEIEKFKFKLYDSNGLLWSREIAKTKLDYPKEENPLEFGQSYFWQIEGEGLLESFKSRSIGFTVVSSEELQIVESQEKKAKEMFKDELNSSSFHFILGAYYNKKGLFEDAITKFEIIAKVNADAPLPHEILGRLYSNIGLKDQAILELQKALRLSQSQ